MSLKAKCESPCLDSCSMCCAGSTNYAIEACKTMFETVILGSLDGELLYPCNSTKRSKDRNVTRAARVWENCTDSGSDPFLKFLWRSLIEIL